MCICREFEILCSKVLIFAVFLCHRAEQITGTHWLQISDVKASSLAKDENTAIFLSVCAVIDTIDILINDMGKEPD